MRGDVVTLLSDVPSKCRTISASDVGRLSKYSYHTGYPDLNGINKHLSDVRYLIKETIFRLRSSNNMAVARIRKS